jgi:hypothetical protein
VLRVGVQALRGLGMRPTELQQCLPLSSATLKRYARQPSEHRDDGSPTRWPALSRRQREVLTLYWVRIIARDEPIAPPVPARPLLAAFCPICLRDPEGGAPGAAVSTSWRPKRLDRLPPTLLTALLLGLRACETGIRPCVSSPARFASLIHAVRARPWDAAIFLGTEVGPRHWWLRTCCRCDRPIVTAGSAFRTCPHHGDAEG